MSDNFELIFAEILAVTKKAVQLDVDGVEFWVPRSVIQDGNRLSEFSTEDEFWVQHWFCVKEGLV